MRGEGKGVRARVRAMVHLSEEAVLRGHGATLGVGGGVGASVALLARVRLRVRVRVRVGHCQS